MDPIVLSALIIGAIAAVMAIGFAAHSFDSRRKLKQQMLNELYVNVQEADDFLFKIPSCYLPGDIRLFLIDFLQTQYHSILALDPRNIPLKQSIDTLNQLHDQKYIHNPDPLKPSFQDVVTAKNNSELVKDMTNFLVRLHQQGLLKSEDAKTLVGKSKIMYLLAKTETEMVAAKHITKQGKPKVALIRYQECKERLKIFEKKNQLPNRLKRLQDEIVEVSNQIKATQEMVNQTSYKDKQDDQWDEYSNESNTEDWKIKQSYD